MPTRDVVVVGASMGGIQALSALAGQLPGDLGAAVLVVQHTSAESPALLGEILSSRGALPAVAAEHGMTMSSGHIFVAPPNRHLLVTEGGRIGVVFGPRENRSRPAIDPLFRSAAVHCRSRVIGVILTGMLGDGAAGLLAIERCGGVPIVQEPDDAAYPEMPKLALLAVGGALRVRLEELGAQLAALVGEPAPEPPPVPEGLRAEVRITERAMQYDDWGELSTRSTDFTCPDCDGALRQVEELGIRRYRCRVGHAFNLDDLLQAKGEKVEEALWVAMQTLKERAQMLSAMAADERERGRANSAAAYEERARETRHHAERLVELLSGLHS